MAEEKSQRAEDSIVREMIKQLPQEKNEEIRRCFRDRFMELKDAPSSWNLVKLAILRKPDAALLKGIRSYRALAVTSVMSKWYGDVYYPSHGKSKRA